MDQNGGLRQAALPWANTVKDMGRIQATNAGTAAIRGEYVEIGVPRPARVESSVLEAKSLSYRYKRFKLGETAAIQSAHATTQGVMVVDSNNRLDSLLDNESHELQDARTHENVAPCGSLPARAMALTCLCHATKGAIVASALDAVAFLASAPDDAGARAAEDTRVAFLCDSMARDYLRHHRLENLDVPDGSHPIELVLVWTTTEENGTLRWNRDRRWLPFDTDQSPYKVCLAFQSLVAQMLDRNDILVWTRLRMCYWENESSMAEEAYGRETQRSAEQIFALTRRIERPVLHESLAGFDGKTGFLDAEEIYLRIIPRTVTVRDHNGRSRVETPGLSHTACKTGILVFMNGMLHRAKQFCQSSHRKEFDLTANQGRHLTAYAIAPPPREFEDICAHVLYVRGDLVELGKMVSAYGTGNVPRARVTSEENNCMWQLVTSLVPLDKALCDSHFVLPRERDDALPATVEFSQFNHLHEQMVQELSKITVLRASTLYKEAEDGSRSVPSLPSPVRLIPTRDQQAIAIAMGMPLTNPAFHVGSVLNSFIADTSLHKSSLTYLLSAVGASYGNHMGVDAMACHLTELVRTDMKRKRTANSNHLLKMAIDHVMQIRDVNSRFATSYVLNDPLDRTAVGSILDTLSFAVGNEGPYLKAKWARNNVIGNDEEYAGDESKIAEIIVSGMNQIIDSSMLEEPLLLLWDTHVYETTKVLAFVVKEDASKKLFVDRFDVDPSDVYSYINGIGCDTGQTRVLHFDNSDRCFSSIQGRSHKRTREDDEED